MYKAIIMITDQRLLHIINVARTAQKLAQKLRPEDDAFMKNMFLLGFLHDIGYEFAPKPELHAEIGGKILQNAGYKYHDCVAQHGLTKDISFSDELYILNLADMLVNFDGHACTLKKRLQDIKKRYGEKSYQYQNSFTLIEKLKSDIRYKIVKI